MPENPTPLQVAKFKLCKKILGYKQDNNLSREVLAERLDLSLAETEDILFADIERFTLDRLVAYNASKLFEPLELDIVQAKTRESLLAPNG